MLRVGVVGISGVPSPVVAVRPCLHGCDNLPRRIESKDDRGCDCGKDDERFHDALECQKWDLVSKSIFTSVIVEIYDIFRVFLTGVTSPVSMS